MTRLELFRLLSMWGNYSFDYACSMSRGRSGGIISMWDPAIFIKQNIWCDANFVIVQGQWINLTGTYFMVNIYGPHDTDAKVILWQKILSFIHQHNGRYVLFGDLNEVREESEQFGSIYSTTEAQTFNSFIDSSGLKEIMMGGRFFTWMNKSGSKMSKLDRFLISEEVMDDNTDLKAMVLDRLLSDHSPILLHSQKTDYGPTPFKFFQSWFQRKDFEEVVKKAFADCSHDSSESRVPLHIKLKSIKQSLKSWNSAHKKKDMSRKQEVIGLIQDIEVKIDASLASDSEKEMRLQLLRELNDIDREWQMQWKRPIVSSRINALWESLQAELQQMTHFEGQDEVRWGIGHDGTFTVGATRHQIDDAILPTLDVSTMWCKIQINLLESVNLLSWKNI
ncbi:RNA-directed DNA polymerase, eukaryota, Reverse transcriptase zinc-binding domain protein [Artemisia annua]|uniref:RNA-directed DNA polymerase, eukaryota, Reverse transcriptase zinc-binding domain protein n=1 Tax=Artemisia annua TaxID=35608 RepID=A0A2U1QMQ7_ARTAN|nr:RNA-directed DNA polymerase, eukaryota, Reverse transcriptase zinc-binding domain protein [Artemisia annua]